MRPRRSPGIPVNFYACRALLSEDLERAALRRRGGCSTGDGVKASRLPSSEASCAAPRSWGGVWAAETGTGATAGCQGLCALGRAPGAGAWHVPVWNPSWMRSSCSV